MSEQWTWPASRAIVLYHWAWFDPRLGDLVVGWSQRAEPDSAGYIHFEAEATTSPRTVEVFDPPSALVKPHTFAGLGALPGELRERRGPPLPWIRELLGA